MVNTVPLPSLCVCHCLSVCLSLPIRLYLYLSLPVCLVCLSVCPCYCLHVYLFLPTPSAHTCIHVLYFFISLLALPPPPPIYSIPFFQGVDMTTWQSCFTQLLLSAVLSPLCHPASLIVSLNSNFFSKIICATTAQSGVLFTDFFVISIAQ